MTPTPELEKRLRKYLNEVIPEGGTAADTRFTDEEIDDLLENAASIYEAAYIGWTIKAGMLEGSIERVTSGQEQYTLSSLKDQLAQALGMADKYQSLAGLGADGVGGISIMGRVRGPRVL